MSNARSGLIAGFIATLVLSALMVMKSMMGLMPEMDVAQMLGTMMGSGPAMGWIGHFIIGTIMWGLLFTVLAEHLPGQAYWQRGVIFGLGAWLLMMVMVMPMAGAGLFGLRMGPMIPVMTAMLHMIFGAVLGASYGTLIASRTAAAS